MKTLLLSPHLDDAVLSAGQFLANQPGCDVLTVFAGKPYTLGKSAVTPYDQKCGFVSSMQAMHARRLEDRDAVGRLQGDPIYWDYLDDQYLEPTDFVTLRDRIAATAQAYDIVIAPIGVSHPDHIYLSDAVLAANTSFGAQIFLWEDLPNRVLYPEMVAARLAQIRGDGHELSLEVPGGAGPMADKVRALLCYRSQLGTGDLDFNLLCVPERFWKLARREGDD